MCSINIKPNYIIRTIRSTDFDEVREMWNIMDFLVIKYANEIMFTTDPEGILVAEDTDSGKLLGYCSFVNVSNDLAFIGGYCVRPEYRGHGIGQNIFNKGMAHTGGRNVGLFAFSQKIFEIYRDCHHFTCIPDRRLCHIRGQLTINKDMIDTIDGITLVAINNDTLPSVIEYDRDLCGMDRGVYIDGLSKCPESIHLVAIDERNQVLGYCLVVNTSIGVTVVEPLYADNAEIAELLVNKCCQQLPESRRKDVNYKCWHFNRESKAIATKLGLIEVKKQMTAFTAKIITGRLEKVFCISSTMYYAF